jgi:hypothetical protein
MVLDVGKNISFLAASASRAANHYSFAERENLADITVGLLAQLVKHTVHNLCMYSAIVDRL